MSNKKLKLLAQQNPSELVKLLTTSTHIETLTQGAEILGGEVEDENLVIPTLFLLLKHSHAFVRESAMVGIASFFDTKSLPADILNKLKAISCYDPSPLNKEFAKDLITTFGSYEH